MFEKCIKCQHLGNDCIPNIYTMSITEVRDWAKKLKEEKGWSNAYLAERSGVPKGTIDFNFCKAGGKCADVTYSTFAPMLCALLESDSTELPCERYIEERSAYDLSRLEAENSELRKHVEDLKEELDSRVSYFKEQMAWRKAVIKVLIGISCTMLLFILCELVIDWMDKGIGFFWR